MFENVGGKLKTIARRYFVVVLCLSVVAFIGLLIAKLNFFIALGSALVIAIGAYLTSLPLYALGQVTENSERLVAIAERAERKGKEEKKEQFAVEFAKIKAAKEENVAQKIEKTEVEKINEYTIVCKNCGTKQRSDRKVCQLCGAKFE